jgi:hypothetical protein
MKINIHDCFGSSAKISPAKARVKILRRDSRSATSLFQRSRSGSGSGGKLELNKIGRKQAVRFFHGALSDARLGRQRPLEFR